MPRITRVYTKTGDDGTTALGGGQRVPKDSPRIEAYGTVDELNSSIGVALAAGLHPTLDAALRVVQNELFHLGSDLCVLEEDKAKRPVPTIEERHVSALEKLMDRMTEEMAPLENLILPGGSPAPRRSSSPARSRAAPSGASSRLPTKRRSARSRFAT